MEPPILANLTSQTMRNIDAQLPCIGGSSSDVVGVTFQQNEYTPQGVAVALAAYLNSVSGGVTTVTVTVDDNNHLVVGRPGNTFWKFYGKDSGVAPTLGLVYPFRSLADVLGVSSTVFIPADSSVTFPSPVNLAQVLSYHININNESQVETTDGSRSTFIIPIHVDSFELQKYNVKENPKQIVTFRNATKVLDIEWTTDTGNILTQHGTWSILLKKV